MFRLRFGLDLYAGLRPVRLYAGCPTPLRDSRAGIDYVVVRENIEGLYAGRHGGSRVEGEVAADTSIITRAGTRRIVEQAFALAEDLRRHADGIVARSPVSTSPMCSRPTPSSARLRPRWPRASRSLRRRYVDAAALYLVSVPRRSTSS